MQQATLLIAIIVSISVLSLKPPQALVAFIAALLWYPDYLRVNLGTLDISVGRIVVALLLLRCLCDEDIRRRFVWSTIDTWVTASLTAWAIIYVIANENMAAALENRGGFIMDTFFVYLVVRFTITDKPSLILFTKAIAVILVPLVMLGVIESLTQWQPFFQMMRFRGWRTIVSEGPIIGEARWGLTRAIGPFSHHIMFGSCFATFLPLVWALRNQAHPWKNSAFVLSGALVIGAMSSMSSCSWMMLGMTLFCLFWEKYPRFVKPILKVLILLAILVEIGSNRHVYHVTASFVNLLGGEWWQRAFIIDSAIADFGKWCWVGMGGVDPGWFAYTNATFTDLNNEFLLVGVQSGLLGLLLFCAVFVVAFRSLANSYRKTTDKELKSIYWAFGSILVATITVWMGVSYFGQMTMLFYCILGLIGSSIPFAGRYSPELNGHFSTRTAYVITPTR